MILAVSGCSSASGIPAAQYRAQQICVWFVPASVSTTLRTPVEAELTNVGWTTAGQITMLAKRVLGHSLPPWDDLPGNDFVAQCGYPAATGATSTTTNCPPGALPASPDASQEFYIDDQRHSSAAIPPVPAPPSIECAYPLVRSN